MQSSEFSLLSQDRGRCLLSPERLIARETWSVRTTLVTVSVVSGITQQLTEINAEVQSYPRPPELSLHSKWISSVH